jgi:hypothetical protein
MGLYAAYFANAFGFDPSGLLGMLFPGQTKPGGPLEPPQWHPTPPIGPPTLTPPGEPEDDCPNLVIAIQLVNQVLQTGACRDWFIRKQSPSPILNVDLHGKCKLLCALGFPAWTVIGGDIAFCDSGCSLDPSQIASLLLHEVAHHACPPVVFGEGCANEGQSVCSDILLELF